MRIFGLFALIPLASLPMAAAATPLQAGSADVQQMNAKLETRFKQADVDHDGKLTRSEAEAGMPRLARNFAKIDQQNNGYLTLDQIRAFAQQAHASGR